MTKKEFNLFGEKVGKEGDFFILQKRLHPDNKNLVIVAVNADLSWEVNPDPIRRAIEAYSYLDMESTHGNDVVIVGIGAVRGGQDNITQEFEDLVVKPFSEEIVDEIGKSCKYDNVRVITGPSLGINNILDNEHIAIIESYMDYLGIKCENAEIQKHVVANHAFVYYELTKKIAGYQALANDIATNPVSYWNMYQILKFIKQAKADLVAESGLHVNNIKFSEVYREPSYPEMPIYGGALSAGAYGFGAMSNFKNCGMNGTGGVYGRRGKDRK